ncbi:peptidoglycan-binding protein [Streptomyces albipurpureus]|uniref:Peptidoglycan-binding protein n=1 Tax=Streptomyces albipurpureus TaxID=2897419 RepID=A0ABT0UMS2_9ACTN|nr:N-acetylmuramoyl-L-alanine amidase [Streptomyces sp. CWNU-1]MCM2388556.1 peptidoglycan-binding protein [Streptomyces sp. CWNU-1]
MAQPMSAAAFVDALRDEGLKVVQVGNWRSNSRSHKGPWGPVHGVMVHHTVTKGTANSVALCRDGHSALPGPLCHGVIDKQGVVHLVGYGRTNHAGLGDDDVLRAVIAEKALPRDNEATTDGNRHFYGFECINLGDGKDPWPAVQLEAIEKASAALCRVHGWSARSVLGHLEWQPGKIDPRGFTMESMRQRVEVRLKGEKPTAPPTKPPVKKPPTKPAYEPFPGAAWFVMGRKSPIIAAMRKRLIAVGCNRYQSSANPDVLGSGDKASYEAWQRKCGYTGAAAKWPPGKKTWDLLKVPNV